MTRARTGILVTLLALVAAVFAFVPAALERHYNTVHARVHPTPSARAIALHRRLIIVDLHADSLLWARDLDRRSQRGSVRGSLFLRRRRRFGSRTAHYSAAPS